MGVTDVSHLFRFSRSGVSRVLYAERDPGHGSNLM